MTAPVLVAVSEAVKVCRECKWRRWQWFTDICVHPAVIHRITGGGRPCSDAREFGPCLHRADLYERKDLRHE